MIYVCNSVIELQNYIPIGKSIKHQFSDFKEGANKWPTTP